MNIRPKTFRAVRDFSVDGHNFALGDPVPHGRILEQLLTLGSFVAEDRSTPADSGPGDAPVADTPAPPSAAPKARRRSAATTKPEEATQ